MTKRSPRLKDNQRFIRALLIFLLVDLIFIALYIARDFLLDANLQIGFLQSEMWLVEKDGGFPEIYQYLKTILAITLLGSLWVKHRTTTYAAWLLAFLFVLVDDAFGLHEAFGNSLLANFKLPTVWGIESFLYVEPLLWGIVGLALLGLIVYGYVHEPKTRTLSRRLAYLFALLFLFAGLADALHAFVDRYGSSLGYARGIMTTVEDGGEMIAMSVMAAYVFSYYLAVTTRYSKGFLPK